MTENSSPKNRLPPDDDSRIVTPNFITEIIDRDVTAGRVDEIVTRFPPEPNGYLHLGHLKAIVLDFGVAHDYGGRTNLRFDDTNPTTENEEFVESMKADLHWLGFDWDLVVHASDYFEQLYGYAVKLIEDDKAYVDSLSEVEIREYRGTVTGSGRESPYRDRPIAESLDLFQRMRRGEFPDGSHVLRAKIDMNSRNMLMRDPLLYRIRHAHHYRTGHAWHVYPMYDFAHPLSDAIEGVTHSLCTLEYDNNRELYDWILDNTVEPPHPHQYEFARLSLEYTVLSKRRLIELVQGGYVSGWDDPRMPTLAGMRRRGLTPAALRDFVNRVGVTKTNSRTDIALLDHSIRDDLNDKAPRVMAVLEPLRLTVTNWPEGDDSEIAAPYWPHDVPREESRPLPMARDLVIERGDFAEDPPKGWRRLAPGWEVRLRHGYVVRCDEVIKDAAGEVVELHCSFDPNTLNRNPEGRKVRGTIHWLAAKAALPAEFRLYDRLFSAPDPVAQDGDVTDRLNGLSLQVKHGLVEPSVAGDPDDRRYQFERLGYFWRDQFDSREDALVFNRIVTLKDSWARPERGPSKAATSEQRLPSSQAKTRDGGGRRERAGAQSGEAEGVGGEKDPVREMNVRQKTLFTQYRDLLGVNARDAALIAADERLSRLFDAAVERHDNPRAIAGWIVNELLRELKSTESDELPLSPDGLGELIALIDEGTISGRAAKEVFAEMLAGGDSPEEIVEAKGLRQLSDESAITPIVERLVADHPEKVAAYRAGKSGLEGFFVGQVMRETGGRANPKLVKDAVQRALA